MPEIPELEHVAAVMTRRLAGREIAGVEILRPIIIRTPAEEFRAAVEGARLRAVRRLGKFLILELGNSVDIAVAPMLNGRFQWCADAKRHARTSFELAFGPAPDDPEPACVRFIDERFLAKAYLAPAGDYADVPVLGGQGPDALDPGLDEDAFLARLKRYRGQVKNVLVNAEFIAGIGNAYADEILFVARIHPFTKVSSLETAERAPPPRRARRDDRVGVRQRRRADRRAHRPQAEGLPPRPPQRRRNPARNAARRSPSWPRTAASPVSAAPASPAPEPRGANS